MVPHNGFPLIGPSGQAVANQFGPHRQMVSMDKWSPTNLVPLDKFRREPKIQGMNWFGTICPGGQDQICWGPFVQGIDFMGIVCPGGQEVGNRNSGIK